MMPVAGDSAGVARPTVATTPVTARQKPRWWADDELSDSIDCRLAGGSADLDAAFRLVHDQYVARGYMSPHPSGRRLSLHHALPTTKVFVAYRGAEPVGTLSLIQDSAIGVPMDDAYRQELATLREWNRSFAEVSALAIATEHRALGLAVLVRLVRMLVLYAAEFARLDALCIAVNPRHVDFYRRAFEFTVFGQLREYEKVNGAPAVALRVDLAKARVAVAERHTRTLGGFCEFLVRQPSYETVTARLRHDLPRSVLTPEQFHRFFVGHDVLTRARADQLAVVQSFYSDVSFEQLRSKDVLEQPLTATPCATVAI
jgi:hypothetical protein